jgi:enamine deaminase RidA (YjgF/YER057c/UK114 family)
MSVKPLHYVPMKPEFRSPFSSGFVAENVRLIFLSGCGPVPTYHKHPHDPVEEAKWFEGGIEEQTRQTFENIRL